MAFNDARHRVPLAELMIDADLRYQPSSQLQALVQQCIVDTEPVLDRPMVPLLNRLAEQGFRPWASCADLYLAVEGLTDTAVGVLSCALARLNVYAIVFAAAFFHELPTTTSFNWSVPAGAEQENDAALLTAAEGVRVMMPSVFMLPPERKSAPALARFVAAQVAMARETHSLGERRMAALSAVVGLNKRDPGIMLSRFDHVLVVYTQAGWTLSFDNHYGPASWIFPNRQARALSAPTLTELWSAITSVLGEPDFSDFLTPAAEKPSSRINGDLGA